MKISWEECFSFAREMEDWNPVKQLAKCNAILLAPRIFIALLMFYQFPPVSIIRLKFPVYEPLPPSTFCIQIRDWKPSPSRAVIQPGFPSYQVVSCLCHQARVVVYLVGQKNRLDHSPRRTGLPIPDSDARIPVHTTVKTSSIAC